MCRINDFTVREFSGIYSLAKLGEFAFLNGNSRWPIDGPQ